MTTDTANSCRLGIRRTHRLVTTDTEICSSPQLPKKPIIKAMALAEMSIVRNLPENDSPGNTVDLITQTRNFFLFFF